MATSQRHLGQWGHLPSTYSFKHLGSYRNETLVYVAWSMGHDPVPPSWPDRHAAAARYHAGQISAQLKIHKALLLHAEIISTVIVSARRDAERSEIRAFRIPWRTPKIAGRRKRNKQSLDRVSKRNVPKQITEGSKDNAALTQRVRRDTNPTTKPPVQDQAMPSSERRCRHCHGVRSRPYSVNGFFDLPTQDVAHLFMAGSVPGPSQGQAWTPCSVPWPR